VGTVQPDERKVAATLAARPEVRVALSTVTGVERSTAPAGGLDVVADAGVLGVDEAVVEPVAVVVPVVGAVGTSVFCDVEPVSSVPLDVMVDAVDRVSAHAPNPMSATAMSTATVGTRSCQGPRRGRCAPLRLDSSDA
jgi:hypothetical protein